MRLTLTKDDPITDEPIVIKATVARRGKAWVLNPDDPRHEWLGIAEYRTRKEMLASLQGPGRNWQVEMDV